MNDKKAILKINDAGILLVFPIANQKEPKSLWSEFFPKSKMRWEWDETGDNRVGDLWALMKRLSVTKQVVYSKWYQGRATFFSIPLFEAMLCLYQHHEPKKKLSQTAKNLLTTLESDSPLSTRELKKLTELQGKDNNANYTKSMKQLFSQLFVVAFGEVDDGAFPSLAVGATQLLYEDLWNRAKKMKPDLAQKIVDQFMPTGSAVRKYFDKINAALK